MRQAGTESVARQDFERRLRQFVRDCCGDRSVRRTTPLFESGMIDSMRILDLIVLVEEMIGRRIADEEIVLGSFRTIDAICATFLVERPAGRRPKPEDRR